MSYPDCWVFDVNRRKYKTDKNGRTIGGPIWKEHWRKVKIVGETSRSWVTSGGLKIPKKGGPQYAFSEDDIDRMAFVEKSWQIADAVRYCKDYETLKRIAEMIGYRD